jgi:flagellar biosynthesis/type III secretory pathway M-ring protein FliF/YscJ
MVVCWQDIVYELRQMDTVMKLAADGHAMSIPVDKFHSCRSPEVTLLDVL